MLLSMTGKDLVRRLQSLASEEFDYPVVFEAGFLSSYNPPVSDIIYEGKFAYSLILSRGSSSMTGRDLLKKLQTFNESQLDTLVKIKNGGWGYDDLESMKVYRAPRGFYNLNNSTSKIVLYADPL